MDLSTLVPNATDAPAAAAPVDWLNRGDNAWQMTAATLVGLQTIPGLMILYGSVVKKKWAVNSAFMVFYAFAAVALCWVVWGFKFAFGNNMIKLWGKPGPALGGQYLLSQAVLPSTAGLIAGSEDPFMLTFPMASLVYFQMVFAGITLALIAGSLLGRMNFLAWMAFVPLWLTFSYTVVAFSTWGGGFLQHWGVVDFAGGYVIHISSGTAGYVAAAWVGPRLKRDRDSFIPNNIVLTLAGAGMLWLGWNGFNGGSTYSAGANSALAILNTNICASTSLLTWTIMDVIYFKKPSVIGAIQGMITGLVVITPGAGLVYGWAAIVMGVVAGTIPWFSMMILARKVAFLQKIDDTLGVVHTHAVAGVLGSLLTGLFAEEKLCIAFGLKPGTKGAFYGNGEQLGKQLVACLFDIGWNIVVTSLVCVFIQYVLRIPLRMSQEHLEIGDAAAHGEEGYTLYEGGRLGEKGFYDYDQTVHGAPITGHEMTEKPLKNGISNV